MSIVILSRDSESSTDTLLEPNSTKVKKHGTEGVDMLPLLLQKKQPTNTPDLLIYVRFSNLNKKLCIWEFAVTNNNKNITYISSLLFRPRHLCGKTTLVVFLPLISVCTPNPLGPSCTSYYFLSLDSRFRSLYRSKLYPRPVRIDRFL